MHALLRAHALGDGRDLVPRCDGVLCECARSVAEHHLAQFEGRQGCGGGRRGRELCDGAYEAAAEGEGERAGVEP